MKVGGFQDEPSARRILKEINGYHVADRKPLMSFTELKADGSTACGVWIYSGVFAPTPQRARRPQPRRQPRR